MEKTVELVISKGKTIPQEIQKCRECGKAIVDADEYEKVRKKLHSSIFTRVKNFFSVCQ